jgi:APA family basic amino acid/polyamine antiporter
VSTLAEVAAPAARAEHRTLLRVLGTTFGIAIAVGASIGGGILRTPGTVAAAIPDASLFLCAWVLGGVNALLGANVFAELGAMIPRSGGLYVFTRRAFGDTMAFFVGYTDWLTYSVSTTALLLLIGEYAGVLVPAFHGHTALVAIGAFVALVVIQWLGVRWGARAQEITSVLKTLALLALVAAVFLLSRERMPDGPTPLAVPHGLALIGALGIAMQGIVFTYDSYYQVVYCGEEMRDPGREVPRAIFRGVLLIIAIYLLVNIAFVAVVPMNRMANDPFVGGTVARWVFGDRGDAIIRGLMIVSVLGTTNALFIATPRILHAMSRDGLFPRVGSYVNRGGTPAVALALTATVVLAFLFSGSFTAVLGLASILIVTRYAVTFAGLFALRRNEPATERPYRAKGYPWLPGLSLLFALAFLVTSAIADVRDTLLVAALLLVSWPAAILARRWRS